MHTVWFPIPVFLRRVVNVISTLSITHHYLLPRRNQSEGEDGERWKMLRELRSIDWAAVFRDESSWMPQLAGYQATRPAIPELEYTRPFVLKATGISITWPQWRWPARLTLSAREVSENGQHDFEPFQPMPANPTPISDPERRPTRDRESEREPASPPDLLHQLLQCPVLYDPVRTPRFPIVLCHGLYGFDVRGPSTFPSLRMHYWSSILGILRKVVGADVIVTAVPGTGSIASRASELNRFLERKANGRGINLMAHSMGGLDCRHLITHLKPTEYTPLSLTTIATPHRGSPFMDWCTEYLGLGRQRSDTERAAAAEIIASASASMARTSKAHAPSSKPSTKPSTKSSPLSLSLSALPSSFTTLLLSMFDSPAYANLTTSYLTNVFNPHTPDDPRVRYFSVAGRVGARGINVWHPLWLPKLVLDGAEERERRRADPHALAGNDGLVTVESARWGDFLGIMEGCDHWDLRGASGIEFGRAMDAGGVRRDVGGSESAEDRWGLGDWGRFVRALGRAERRQEREIERGIRKGSQTEVEKEEVKEQKMEERERTREDVLKASTERLSAVFDWLVEQVPTDALGIRVGGDKAKKQEKEKKSDLETNKDLERFYVALCKEAV